MSLGGVPISLSNAEMLDALQKGVIDGIIATPSMVNSYSLTQSLKYSSKLRFGYEVGMINMNLSTWNKLPEDLKIIIAVAAAKAPYSYVQQFNADNSKVNDTIISSGGQVYTLSAEELTAWTIGFKPVIDKWVADTEANGLPAKDLVNAIRTECQKSGIAFPY
jgi:TRAP-type C4-dicarboxylate transport system substrate-binding protein